MSSMAEMVAMKRRYHRVWPLSTYRSMLVFLGRHSGSAGAIASARSEYCTSMKGRHRPTKSCALHHDLREKERRRDWQEKQIERQLQ